MLWTRKGNPITDVEGNSVVNPTNTRTEILDDVLARVREDLVAAQESFGVEMIDIRIKRADFPAEVARAGFSSECGPTAKRSPARLRAEG